MLPRWHIFWGAILTAVLWVFNQDIQLYALVLVFLASIFIDLDHYICAVLKTRKLSLSDAFLYHKKAEQHHQAERARGILNRGDFHLFHTLEFHVLMGLLALFHTSFLYIFIGMIFHSLLDLGYILHKDVLYRREYFFFNWLGEKF